MRIVICATLALAFASVAALAPGAQAATEAKPAWKVLAVSGPTNLPTKQSQIQQVAVEAEGGTFRLLRKAGTGSATPVIAAGVLKVEKDNVEATITSGSYEVGERVTSTGVFPAETLIVSCSPDCTTAGSTLTLSKAPESPASGTASKVVKVFPRRLSAASGSFHVGDILSGTGIAAGTAITAVEGTTLTTTKATTSAYSSGAVALTITEPTAPIPYDASAEELQQALDAMPAFTPGSFEAGGGPGGDSKHPYAITFAGPLAEQQVEGFTVEPGGLTGNEGHAFAHIVTTVPGGPGTGTIVVLPANIGGKATKGLVTVTVGPLPAGIVTSGPSVGKEWECAGSAAGQSFITCATTRALPRLAASAYPLDVPIEVEPTAPYESSVSVEISGGGAARPATYQLPIVVSNERAPFGLAAIWAGAYEADGTEVDQAGTHPYSAAYYVMVNSVRNRSGMVVPAADSRDELVDLQPGFVGNPLASKRCPQSEPYETENGSELCNREMSVGTLAPYVGSIEETVTFENEPLFNDDPPEGYAGAFTAQLIGPVQTVLASVSGENDYGIRLSAFNNANFDKIFGTFAAFEGVPANGNGQALLTTPSDCAEEARETPVIQLMADSWQDAGDFTAPTEVPVLPVTNCRDLKFEAQTPQTGEGQVGFSFEPGSTTGSSPVGAVAHLHIDQSGLINPNELATPDLKRSVIKLPAGLDFNPSSANGLEACSEAQIGYLGNNFGPPSPIRFDEAQPTCPDGSKLGTAEVKTPLLENPLVGTIYLAAQEANPFGSLLAIYLVVDDPRTGVLVKLPGEVRTNPQTGQLTAVFDYNPQLPFEDLYLRFRGGGPQSQFSTPEVCGTYTSEGEWTPWSAPESGPPANTQGSFRVGSNCAGSASTRPFSPSFEAGTQSAMAGAYAPLVIRVDRKDGEQELSSLDFTLPAGVTGKLAGIPYCGDAEIGTAEHKSGRQEQANPSCPSASELGSVDTSAGVGSEPFHLGGHVYLAGPYKGAPFSSVVIIPAVAGPLDLGDVVVRAPIYVNPETAVLTARSDPIPTILQGIPLKVRSVRIDIDRSRFALNPTNCELMSASASIGSSDGATANPSNRFQVGGCEGLRFAPKLTVSLNGGSRRNGNPALIATLNRPAGQANIGRISVALPHSEFLEQNHIKTVCTRAQFGAEQCPVGSIYGSAEAVTPLLDQPLTGPVYLRSSSHRLPDIVVALKGPPGQPIEVDLDGRIDSLHGGIRVTFETVPDVPVSKFILRMRGGKKSLIVNSTNICQGAHKSTVRMTGQNGKQHNFLMPLKAQCKKQKKHGRKSKKHKKSVKKVTWRPAATLRLPW